LAAGLGFIFSSISPAAGTRILPFPLPTARHNIFLEEAWRLNFSHHHLGIFILFDREKIPEDRR
jgi:hypothetical protein